MTWLAGLFTRLAELRGNKVFWLLLTIPNLFGIVFGYYYYWDVGQFDPSSQYYVKPWLWLFVSDSPNAVLLMQISITWWCFGRGRSKILDGLAFIHMVYVGLWTTLLFSLYPDQLGTFDWGGTNNILFFSHMGMPLEALVLAKPLWDDITSWKLAGGLAAWSGFNLWLDYGSPDLRPAPFVDAGPELATGSIILMAVSYLAWLALVRQAMTRQRPLPPP